MPSTVYRVDYTAVFLLLAFSVLDVLALRGNAQSSKIQTKN